jgi:membrane-bound metal-dependent hydrolase YbcI (DUF457 family)
LLGFGALWWDSEKAFALVYSSGVLIYGSHIPGGIFTVPSVRIVQAKVVVVVGALDVGLNVRSDPTGSLVLAIVRRSVTAVRG